MLRYIAYARAVDDCLDEQVFSFRGYIPEKNDLVEHDGRLYKIFLVECDYESKTIPTPERADEAIDATTYFLKVDVVSYTARLNEYLERRKKENA